MRNAVAILFTVAALLVAPSLRAAPLDRPLVLAQQATPSATAKDDDLLEAKYNRRFPQPTKVGHLIGLPVLDDNDVTLRVRTTCCAHAGRKTRADRVLQQMVRLVRAAGCGADRSGHHSRAATRFCSKCSRKTTRKRRPGCREKTKSFLTATPSASRSGDADHFAR